MAALEWCILVHLPLCSDFFTAFTNGVNKKGLHL